VARWIFEKNVPSASAASHNATAFLSYAREDCEFAMRLRNELAARGVEVKGDWLLVRGEDYRQQLDMLIAAADAFVFVITPDAAASV
jgi:hypothetical protein